MSKTVDITLAAAGTDTGPFNIYSDSDSYANPFVTGVLKADLLSGYTSSVVPTDATIVRVKSTGTCTSSVDMNIVNPTGCTFSGGYTQVFSKITNNGNTSVQVILSKNNGTAFTATTVAANSSAEIYLSGTTFTDTDSLKVNIVSGGSSNINVGSSPTILPNGGAALSYTSLTGNSSHSITAIFNGDHAGWGVGSDMFWFNLTFTASAV
jgi:hypothetical protein